LPKVLSLPKISTNVIYYKRQLNLYNLGIHNGKGRKGYFYVWIENEGGHGAQSVGSAIKKHIIIIIIMFVYKNNDKTHCT